MVADFTKNHPTTVRETIAWLRRIGRPPLPECPIEAAKQGKEPKAPCFLDGKYLKSVNWKQWQNTQPLPEITDAWFANPKTGIGTLGGSNGKHWFGWVDFDQKDFASAEECDQAIETWLDQYPVVANAPMFRTPSGGYRFLIAFTKEPENFKANSGFSLQPDGSHHVGELLTKNGSHTLLPPTVGVNGKPYRWERWNEYPPIVEQPEDVGLYRVQKRTDTKLPVTSINKDESKANTTLSDFLEKVIYPKLTASVAYNWEGHDFKVDGDKLRGYCPFHESASGTAFYVDPKNGTYAWRCPSCEISGYPVQYRHRLAGGNGSPRGKDFVEIVGQLAADVGVEMPETSRNIEGVGRNRTSNNVVDLRSVSRPQPLEQKLPLTEEQVYEHIDDLLNQNLQPSKLTSQLNLLASETDFLNPSEVKRLYYERLREQDQVETREERTTEVDELLKVGSLSLKLVDELPAMYAQPLIKLAKYLSLREEVYLLALLTGVSICHQTGTEIILHHGQVFDAPLTLFSGIVSESGQRKSPVIKAIITKPLQVLQREAKVDHKAATSRYEADLERWDDLNKEEREEEFPDGKPQPPTQQKLFFFTSTSGSESINRQVAAHPDQPLLYLKDELMGVFTQQGKYSQGRGSEKQDFLSYYDGTGSTELLADGVRSDTEKVLLSIFGSVQPEVLRKFTNNCTDPDGQWARFLWVNQPLSAATLHDDFGGGVDVTELFAGLYRQVNMLPPTTYTLSRDAFKLYQKIYDQLEQSRVNCPDPGLRAVYSKMEGQLGRLVGNCHVIHELASGKQIPDTVIPLERMQQGVRLIKFFFEQVKLIRSDSAAAQGELSDVLVKIIQLSQRLGRIKAKQVQINHRSFNLNPDQIRDYFLELSTMGHGVTYGSGRKLEWEYKPKLPEASPVVEKVVAVVEKVVEPTTDETTPQQGLEEKVVKVVEVVDFSENLNPSSGVPETQPNEVGADTWDCISGEWLAPEPVKTDLNNSDLPTTLTTPTTFAQNLVSENVTAVVEPTTFSTTPTTLTTISPTRDEAVQQSALMLIDLADSITSYAMLKELILKWDSDYLCDVWELLPQELHLKFAQLFADGDHDPDGGGSGGTSVVPPAPTSNDDGGGAVVEIQPQESAPQNTTDTTTHLSEVTTLDSQQMTLSLPLAESSTVPVLLPHDVEWLDPESANYQNQCQAIADAPIVALDIETYQADKPKKNATPKALHPWQSQIRLIQLCIGEQTYLVDLGGRDSNFENVLERQKTTIDLLRQVLQNPEQRIVGHNIHFDLRFLATKLGIRNAKNIVCTRVGAQVFYGDYGKLEGQNQTAGNHEQILVGGYSLQNLAHRILDASLDKGEQKSDWGGVLTSDQIKYAAQDPRTTLRVYEALETLYIDKDSPLHSEGLRDCWRLECDAIPCAIEIELAGLPLDTDAARQQLDTIGKHRLALLEHWAKLCPDLKYTQRDKLLKHLNNEHQLGLLKLDKGSLNKKTRENPIIQIKLKLQGLDALANNLKGFLASAARDGRVHTNYKTLTGTGRFSSGGGASDLPNLQAIKAKSNPVLDEFNLPSVREVIRPQPGRTMAVIDLAGAHGRIAASETQDETAIAGNNDPSIDNHLKVAVFIAKRVFEKSVEQ